MGIKTAIGLMSGTSMDGIDVALIRTDGGGFVEFGPSMAVNYAPAMRKQIECGLEEAKEIIRRSDRPGKLADLERSITLAHADAVAGFLDKNQFTCGDIDVIGFHGQTVLHRPDEGLTVQLGDGRLLAAKTGIDVVYDMRAADMEAGGQGAPLVPVFHQALADRLTRPRPLAFVNIGGISNITYVGEDDELIAFDTGPGNALIDQWVQDQGGIPLDQGGRIASEGRVLVAIADRYLSATFFSKAGPKSLDRNDFSPLAAGEADLADGARTLAHVSAASIIRAVDHLPKPPKSWIICGGGRLNDTLMSELRSLAAASAGEVIASDEVELQGDMLEAQAFGYLAVRSIARKPSTFPTTTGCRVPTIGGVLVSSQAARSASSLPGAVKDA